MDQDPEKITWLAGAVGGGAAIATVAFHAVKKWWNPGQKKQEPDPIANLHERFSKLEVGFSDTQTMLRTFLLDHTRAVTRLETTVEEHGRKLDRHGDQLRDLERKGTAG